ncbi:MAG: GyrI-like domain-containing protein [Firmicutes bacterium]|nr:GyrI-like domain-containing protein [Bacillota bacterium]
MKYVINDYPERYFAGIEYPNGVELNQQVEIQKIWVEFLEISKEKIAQKKNPLKFIGLECYPPDFMDIKVFDYYALVETDGLIEGNEEIITKRLPKGRYICFEISFDDLQNEIKRVYKYLQEQKIRVHKSFDIEDYLISENYGEKGAKLNFSFLLDEDVK